MDSQILYVRIALLVGIACCVWDPVTANLCGGCTQSTIDIEQACRNQIASTRVVYYKAKGWWFVRRTKTKVQVFYTQGNPYCCQGYQIRGDECVKDCGGCQNPSIPSQRACLKREPSGRVLYHCCSGHTLHGIICRKTSSVSTACGISRYNNAGTRITQIIGGISARKNEFPWQVLVKIGTNQQCGGTIIGNKWVVTSTHCTHGRPTNGITVVAGEHRISTNDNTEQIRSLSGIHEHHSYIQNISANDIALLELQTALTFNRNVRAACLPNRLTNYNYESVVISGWGKISASSSHLPNTLQYTRVTVVPKSVCDNEYRQQFYKILCATDDRGDIERSPCSGDSGGPMVIKKQGIFTLIGVSAFVSGRGCARGLPFGYTDVSSYINWINQVTGI